MLNECELTILMPCLNEAETLAGCIEQARTGLNRAGLRGEVLIADNGSTDGFVAKFGPLQGDSCREEGEGGGAGN